MGSRKWLEGTPNLYAASVIVTAGVLHDSQGVSIAQCQILVKLNKRHVCSFVALYTCHW